MILAEAGSHAGFIQDYLSVQFDPAHLLSELGFELVQAFGVYVAWKRWIKPRFMKQVHEQIDSEHGVTHADTGTKETVQRLPVPAKRR